MRLSRATEQREITQRTKQRHQDMFFSINAPAALQTLSKQAVADLRLCTYLLPEGIISRTFLFLANPRNAKNKTKQKESKLRQNLRFN